MTKYVLSVDGSEYSHHAFDLVVNRLMKADDFLTIVTVSEQPPAADVPILLDDLDMSAAFMYKSKPEIMREIRATSKALLEKYARLCTERKIQYAVGELVGNPRDELCDFVEKEKPDFLVCGSRGLGLMKRIMLGSVSDYLVHHASCPVLVVKAPPSGTSTTGNGHAAPAIDDEKSQ